MGQIQITAVDERDSSWEDREPRFRVYLHTSGADDTHGSTSTHDLLGVDILQAIDWAQRQAGDSRTYAIALVWDDSQRELETPGDGRGLVWLVGMDGNETPQDEGALAVQRRMLARRDRPVVLSEADRLPPRSPV